MIFHEPVQTAIWQCLNHFNYEDSIFLSERLYAEVGNEVALHLLASCYYRMGKVKSAYLLLQNKMAVSTECRLLLAQCCLDLEKYSEGEFALNGGIFVQKAKTLDEIVFEFSENACFAVRLLGLIMLKTERKAKAIECFQLSLKLNPFLWSSFQYLCELGVETDLTRIFQISNLNLNVICHPSHNSTFLNSPIEILSTSQEDQVTTTKHQLIEAMSPEVILQTQQNNAQSNQQSNQQEQNSDKVVATCKKMNRVVPGRAFNTLNLSPLTPSFGFMPLEFTPTPNHEPFLVSPSPVLTTLKTSVARNTPAGQPLTLFGNSRLSVFNQSSKNTNLSKETQQTNQQNLLGLRRSSRLFSNLASSSVKENNKNQIENKLSSPRAPSKRTKSKLSWTPQEMNEKNRAEDLKANALNANAQTEFFQLQKQSANGLMQLLQDIARAYIALQKYNCKQAIELFNALPVHHLNTAWVLCHIGRAYFEMANYHSAEKAFLEVRSKFPHHVESMDVYSTVLWHLQQEIKLSSLAQELTTMDKLAPEAWCATGNCFSLQKEHDVAIRFFQRAIQCNPNFAYAYTLLGHEYVLIEELDKAMNAFQNAVRINPRHYNAWYGIGMVHYKQEKFISSLLYYERALSINPNSPILLCHIGVVQSELKQFSTALSTLDRAIAIDPKCVLPKFHHASILFSTEKYEEALTELQLIKDTIPNESLVFFLIGKIYKKMGKTHLALMNFSWAMELDPKGMNNHIKETINKRYLNEEDDWLGNFVPSTTPPAATPNNQPVEAYDMYEAD